VRKEVQVFPLTHSHLEFLATFCRKFLKLYRDKLAIRRIINLKNHFFSDLLFIKIPLNVQRLYNLYLGVKVSKVYTWDVHTALIPHQISPEISYEEYHYQSI
jgi:hypothetical protein